MSNVHREITKLKMKVSVATTSPKVCLKNGGTNDSYYAGTSARRLGES